MNQRLISEIGKSQRLQIINQLKRTEGMSVKELAAALDMSYMGIKQHCLDLEEAGYLDHWRRPQPVGRPEMLYRLTRRTEELFPVASNGLSLELLEAARRLFGPQAAEKLLFLVFQSKAEGYRVRIKAETLEDKAKWLARLRDHDGYMAEFRMEGQAITITEYHSPILGLLRAFPAVGRLEEKMFEEILGVSVRREERTKSGLYNCKFAILTPV